MKGFSWEYELVTLILAQNKNKLHYVRWGIDAHRFVVFHVRSYLVERQVSDLPASP